MRGQQLPGRHWPGLLCWQTEQLSLCWAALPAFRPEVAEEDGSLAIAGGLGGARLTHNHERQFHYVLQSLTLWREISHEARAAHPPDALSAAFSPALAWCLALLAAAATPSRHA